mmetsp:Transcript_41830/g.131081  ORF Transcript_41830/g.131081 Transcript_41830/m.131081 type:complete len:102 (+) Transcript_41830:2306-2611(+)
MQRKEVFGSAAAPHAPTRLRDRNLRLQSLGQGQLMQKETKTNFWHVSPWISLKLITPKPKGPKPNREPKPYAKSLSVVGGRRRRRRRCTAGGGGGGGGVDL